jgi:hypothetical protein
VLATKVTKVTKTVGSRHLLQRALRPAAWAWLFSVEPLSLQSSVWTVLLAWFLAPGYWLKKELWRV